MSHRKSKETKQQPSMLPGPAVPGCCLVYFHVPVGHPTHPPCTVYRDTGAEAPCFCPRILQAQLKNNTCGHWDTPPPNVGWRKIFTISLTQWVHQSVYIRGYDPKKESKIASKKVDFSHFLPPKKYPWTPPKVLFDTRMIINVSKVARIHPKNNSWPQSCKRNFFGHYLILLGFPSLACQPRGPT